jgi:zinc protease
MNTLGFLIALGSLLAFPIGRSTLNNGMAILSVEEHKLPMVELRLVVKAGSSQDPKGKEGLANFVGDLLLRGTKTRTTLQLSDELEFLGAGYGSSADEDELSVDIRARAQDLDRVLELLADIILNPAFPDSEIMRVKGEAISELIREKDEPFSVASRAFGEILYGPHPYGHPVNGYQAGIAAVTRDDIVKFYNDYFAPNNAFLVAVGDFTNEALEAKIEKYFSAWQQKPVIFPPVAEPPTISKPKVKVIKKPEINQDYIILGNIGIAENSPQVFPARLMAYILGSSGLTSRITTKIREEKGLAYDASAYLERKLYPGPFVAQLQTETKNGQEAIKSLVEEIRRMKEKGVTEKELADAKAYYVGHFPLSFDSFGERVWMVTQIERYGLGLDYVDKYLDRIKAVKREEVNQAARELLFPDNYVLIILGNVDKSDFNLGDVEWLE